MATLKAGITKRTTSSRWAEESRKQARESGELPHEFLLRVARGEPIDIVELNEEGLRIAKIYYPTFSDRVECANACANYFAPKLTAQQTESMDPVSEMTDEELNRKLAEFNAK